MSASPVSVGVLVPHRDGEVPGAPEDMPIGRVALALRDEGIQVVFGARAEAGRLTGHVAAPGRWEPVTDVPVVAAYDRYPSQKDPDGHAALRRGLEGLPFANPLSLTLLCRDKLACQRHLEARGVALPPVEDEPARFAARLDAWGAGFVKPRFGAFGIGITRVVPGDPLPSAVEGTLPGVAEPALLQRAVDAPAGWAGVCTRLLVQREGARWVANPAVARRSRVDPVVNVHRGAEAAPADDVLSPATLAAVAAQGLAVAEAMADHPDGHLLIELGVDAVIDPDGIPRLIEVNSRPRGRLEALADADPGRFGALHLAACARPLRTLAGLATPGARP